MGIGGTFPQKMFILDGQGRQIAGAYADDRNGAGLRQLAGKLYALLLGSLLAPEYLLRREAERLDALGSVVPGKQPVALGLRESIAPRFLSVPHTHGKLFQRGHRLKLYGTVLLDRSQTFVAGLPQLVDQLL